MLMYIRTKFRDYSLCLQEILGMGEGIIAQLIAKASVMACLKISSNFIPYENQ